MNPEKLLLSPLPSLCCQGFIDKFNSKYCYDIVLCTRLSLHRQFSVELVTDVSFMTTTRNTETAVLGSAFIFNCEPRTSKWKLKVVKIEGQFKGHWYLFLERGTKSVIPKSRFQKAVHSTNISRQSPIRTPVRNWQWLTPVRMKTWALPHSEINYNLSDIMLLRDYMAPELLPRVSCSTDGGVWNPVEG